MTIDEDVQELELELSQLKEELRIINKYLVQDKKMGNTRFKGLMVEKAEIEKNITEVELDIELLKAEIESNNQTTK